MQSAPPQLGQNPNAGIPAPNIPQQPNISQPNLEQPTQQVSPQIPQQNPQQVPQQTPQVQQKPETPKPEGSMPPKPEEKKQKTIESYKQELQEELEIAIKDLDVITDPNEYRDLEEYIEGLKTSIREHKKSNESFKNVVRACGCKEKAIESINNYKKFVSDQITLLKKRAKTGEAVSLMYGLPSISKQGRKIKGTLAYAGVSLNDRIYLPEELAKGHERRLPLLLNHSSTAGAEKELDRLSEVMLDHLYNEKDYKVGEVVLNWDPEKLTLFYEGVVDDKFFQKEIDDMDMAVSLGIYYDSDSPKICDESCYTVIKGAEFREVSLVYHAGFPIATIEAVEAELKQKSLKAIEDHLKSNSFKDPTGQGNTKEQIKDFYNPKEEAEEELDILQPQEQPIDVEEKPVGEPLTIDINEDTPVSVEALTTMHNFSVRGVNGFTVSNMNGVERYKIDADSYLHLNVNHNGANIKGENIVVSEQLQPKLTMPEETNKEIMKKPSFNLEDGGKDILNDI